VREQLTNIQDWFGQPGGHAESLKVPDYRYLLPAGGLKTQDAVVLTVAGMSSYRVSAENIIAESTREMSSYRKREVEVVIN
jgi:hypothetical protein